MAVVATGVVAVALGELSTFCTSLCDRPCQIGFASLDHKLDINWFCCAVVA